MKVVFYEYSKACKKTYRKDILTNSTALFFTTTPSPTVPEKNEKYLNSRMSQKKHLFPFRSIFSGKPSLIFLKI